MARGRMLSWKISIDGRVAHLPPTGQLLFTWMIAHADNCGRLRADPAYLRATVIPNIPKVTDRDVVGWLGIMHNLKLIQLYTVEGGKFCRFFGWEKHQRMDRAVKSELPPPDNQWLPVVVSGCQWLPEVEGKGIEGEEEAASADAVRSVVAGLRKEWQASFHEHFWPGWPDKVAKDEAIAAWAKLFDPKEGQEYHEKLLGDVMDGVDWWIKNRWTRPDTNYPHASTFLNNGRWKAIHEAKTR